MRVLEMRVMSHPAPPFNVEDARSYDHFADIFSQSASTQRRPIRKPLEANLLVSLPQAENKRGCSVYLLSPTLSLL
ncbi:hypothetical protein PRIPAC_76635 [Pristionchus pacificus]|uniref:Uncharacterized protein n=1 Tax=Pristionchus pacificus TaxID=54126 RepID=A0A2A6C7G6_PRIPA|nr:hypothetical protein PRIPAC_76635 [Pristionchus pacificus]|eukprot:PDM74018.1 hypothetical protein PRIPAC_41374 [Pristionchus pacificus]